MSPRALSRIAMAGIVTVLVAVSAFAFWSTHTTAASARRAVAASAVSGYYEQALASVIRQDAAEHAYRQHAAPASRQQFEAAAAQLISAMRLLGGQTGGAAAPSETEQVLPLQAAQLRAVRGMFAAVDGGDTAAADRLMAADIQPRTVQIGRLVTAGAEAHRDAGVRALTELRHRVSFTATLRPVVFAIGFALMLLLAWVLRRIRRELDQQREQALRDSLHDPLTGLANRAMLARRFDEALQRGQSDGSRTGLLLLDLDRFKEINDTLGHHYGDELLTQVGPRLKESLRPEDTVARLGGDEFAVLLPGVDGLDTALVVAERLREALTGPFPIDGMTLDIEASIGVVVSGEHGDDASTLLQRADIAMYVAKKQSIGVFAYDPEADGNTPQKLTVLGDLRRALERHELVLHYQPKISLGTGDVCGVEALVRWQDPQLGLVPPDQFIPLAERTGLIAALTDYVVDAALAQARSWLDTGRELPIAVNLSARNLLDVRLAHKIGELLRRHGVPAALLELEVTESALMTDPLRAQQTLMQLHQLGIRIAIDDFGVGYTNLSQLRTLPVTDLKIDRSFVTTMDVDASNAHIVNSVIDLSRNLGITTIAEGVENRATLDALRLAGCDMAQGHYISRPLPADAVTSWIAAHRGGGTHGRSSAGSAHGRPTTGHPLSVGPRLIRPA
jgi:diguanylate cyclase